jgi:dihydroorotate dehydrogenase (fumarate)
MADLKTTYMGISLKNPIVPSASPLSCNLDDIKALEDGGAPAVVLYSLFEEQIGLAAEELSHLFTAGAASFADAEAYFPKMQEYPRDPDAYVEHLQKAKEAVDIPIIASMNGTSAGGWLEYATRIEDAGADGLELNVYYIPTTDTFFGLDVETLYLDILNSVTNRVSIPVAVKLSPFFSALPNFASRLDEAGADALVLFNRFYQPDINVKEKTVEPRITLSKDSDLLLPLRWIAILYGQIECSLALTSGVHTPEAVLKSLLVGADVANVCSVLLREGTGKMKELVDGTAQLMDELGIDSVSSIRGSMSLEQYAEPAAFERASYIKLLQGYGRLT